MVRDGIGGIKRNKQIKVLITCLVIIQHHIIMYLTILEILNHMHIILNITHGYKHESHTQAMWVTNWTHNGSMGSNDEERCPIVIPLILYGSSKYWVMATILFLKGHGWTKTCLLIPCCGMRQECGVANLSKVRVVIVTSCDLTYLSSNGGLSLGDSWEDVIEGRDVRHHWLLIWLGDIHI